MLIIIIIRFAIWGTFILLIIKAIADIVWQVHFAARYERRHRELELRIESLEQRLPGESTKK